MANVVLYMSDEHNPFFSSAHGHRSIQTPNMERLAETGTLYRNCYCPSPLCLPSRSAFMSGRRVHQIQTYNNCNALLDRGIPSYGRLLAQQGAHTAYIGKTDVYAPGEELGFSEMIMPGDRAQPGDTNHRRNPLQVRTGSAARADGYGPKENAGSGDRRCVNAAIQWLQTRAPELDKPWVLVVNTGNPHFPHYAPPDLWELYEGEGDLPDHGPECASARHPRAVDLRRHFETDRFSEEQIRGLRRGYLACVSFVDRQIGRLTETLGTTGLENNTNLIYTSDHGEMLGKFGMWWKCTLYEDSVRVPCIARGPDFPTGQTVKTPVDLHDVQATLFSATNAERNPDWVGKPLPTIPRDNRERIVFSEYHGHGVHASSYALRRGKWKYIHHVDAPNQLFDLQSDPDELTDLTSDRPGTANELESELRKICSPEKENRRAERFIEQQLAAVADPKEE